MQRLNLEYYVEADAITPNLYVGALESAEDLDFLKKENITHVLTLCRTNPFEQHKPDFVCHKYAPIYDEGPMTEEWIDDVLEWIDPIFIKNKDAICMDGSDIYKEQKLLIHCTMGINRSATVAIAYLMFRYDWDWETAYNKVKGARSFISPRKDLEKDVKQYFENL